VFKKSSIIWQETVEAKSTGGWYCLASYSSRLRAIIRLLSLW